jgi:hypothetical protein
LKKLLESLSIVDDTKKDIDSYSNSKLRFSKLKDNIHKRLQDIEIFHDDLLAIHDKM